MSKGQIRELHETIRRDRDEVRSGFLDTLPAGGKVDRERLRRIAQVDRIELYRTEGARNTAEYVSAVCHISKWKARRLIEAAHSLESLPHISAALEAGSLSLDKTVELTRFATPETEKKLLRWARKVTVGCIRQRGDEALAQPKENIEAAHHNRELKLNWADHGLYFEGFMPHEQAVAFVEEVDRLAHELPEDPDALPVLFEGQEAPSMGQRRLDSLFLLTTSGGGHSAATPSVVVHVPLEVLAVGDGNGVADNGQVLDPEVVRMLCCDSRLQTVVEDPAGHPLGVGRETATPPRWLRRLVLKRDGHTCTFPGCGMKRFLQLHHVRHWSQGGPTDYRNLATVCPVHHALIHKMGWTVLIEDGEVTWLQPRARRYEPGPVPPDPPAEPVRRKALHAEAAAVSGLDRLIAVLAA
ncbi:MAG TPA: DUF222 domain-containing protein [Actinomycetota bacterium]|nr:DUF222 domain-containing protein [Actinomycetota bacterium]